MPTIIIPINEWIKNSRLAIPYAIIPVQKIITILNKQFCNKVAKIICDYLSIQHVHTAEVIDFSTLDNF
jgi:hypothetical protein